MNMLIEIWFNREQIDSREPFYISNVLGNTLTITLVLGNSLSFAR